MLGLYVHFPFCAKKCSYCDFVSFAKCERLIPAYIERLKQEAAQYKGEKIYTVFFGGGTPSLMTVEQIKELTDFLHRCFIISSDAEVTIECNPASLTLEKLKAYKASGINRISVGAQSLSDNMLEKIGRAHTVEQLENAVENISLAGFDNFNLDLIFALPGQTLQMWQNTLKHCLSLKPKHISCYSLTIDEATPLGKAVKNGEVTLPDEETERQMYYLTNQMFRENGIEQYEISNYAYPGFECKHNKNYWLCGEYIGLGCAAHSYYNGARYSNTTDLTEYSNGSFDKKDFERLSEKDKLSEKIIFGLRMNEGVDTHLFDCFEKERDKNIAGGFLKLNGGKISLTDRGRDFLDKISLDFLD